MCPRILREMQVRAAPSGKRQEERTFSGGRAAVCDGRSVTGGAQGRGNRRSISVWSRKRGPGPKIPIFYDFGAHCLVLYPLVYLAHTGSSKPVGWQTCKESRTGSHPTLSFTVSAAAFALDGRAESLWQRLHGPQTLKCSAPGPLQKFADPWYKQPVFVSAKGT